MAMHIVTIDPTTSLHHMYIAREFIFHIATTLEQAHNRNTKLGGLPERHLAHQSWPPIPTLAARRMRRRYCRDIYHQTGAECARTVYVCGTAEAVGARACPLNGAQFPLLRGSGSSRGSVAGGGGRCVTYLRSGCHDSSVIDVVDTCSLRPGTRRHVTAITWPSLNDAQSPTDAAVYAHVNVCKIKHDYRRHQAPPSRSGAVPCRVGLSIRSRVKSVPPANEWLKSTPYTCVSFAWLTCINRSPAFYFFAFYSSILFELRSTTSK